MGKAKLLGLVVVSTHSRPKAAGWHLVFGQSHPDRFNSQPPEGGWVKTLDDVFSFREFQLTAARRRLAEQIVDMLKSEVSTHSRPKAAG